MSLWNAVCSVLLCFSVRGRTIARLAGEVFLSQSAQSSRSFLAHSFEPTEGLRHTENTERFSFRWVWCMWERRVHVMRKNPYNPPYWPRSQIADSIAYNRGYNPQEISVLCFAFEYMPFLLVEDALLDARRACSRTLKSLLLFQTRPFLDCRGDYSVKYLDISYLHG